MGFLRLESIGATVRWTEMGSGEPLVILPGLSMPVLTGFAAVAGDPALAGRWRILIDYPGSGHSDHPDLFDYELDSQARIVAAVLDRLDTGPADVLGHSMGGSVAIRLAADRPDLVRRLIAAEANLFPGGGVMSLRVAAEGREAFLDGGHAALLDDLRRKAKNGVGWADRLWAGWRVADPEGLYGNARALLDLDEAFYGMFAGLPVPKTFIYGALTVQGAPTPDMPDPARLEADGIAIEVIEGAGHAMMVDNHAGFVAALARALDR